MHRGTRVRAVCVLVGVGSLMVATSGAFAKETKKPDGTVRLSEGSVAAGIGFSWGGGVLSYKGKTYHFKVNGLSLGSVGIAKASASGKVYNLHKLEDFNGTYTAASAGATLAGGGSAASMRNQNGVVMDVFATTKGVKLTLAVSGVTVTLDQ